MIMEGLKKFSLLVSIACTLMLTGCEKYVRPNKVERIVEDNKWSVSNCIVNGVNYEFLNTEFHFREAGYIAVSATDTLNGKWTVGLNKKPTTLYISSFLYDPYFVLNDSWEVLTAAKNRLTMRAEHGNVVNSLTLIRIED